jgi:K+-sensing histidine kinase KdpD
MTHVKVAVTDSGIGIKTCDKPKLFKLFGMLDHTKQVNTNGIGLGLVISQLIV